MTEQNLLKLFQKYALKVTTAESCTGGLLAGTLCDISGISAHFEEGFITYSEKAKIKNLGVSADTIETYGVVSLQTAEEMAKGVLQRAEADCSIAITGIAGPTGGTKENPVGTVCFACVVKGQVYSKRLIFEGSRIEIRTQAVVYAIELLADCIKNMYEEKGGSVYANYSRKC